MFAAINQVKKSEIRWYLDYNEEKSQYDKLAMNTKETIASIDHCLNPFLILTNRKSNLVLFDNAPSHVSKKTQEFLSTIGVEYIPFGGKNGGIYGGYPANSPDLNPIENIFGILQEKVNSKQPKNVDELIDTVANEWNEIDMNHIRKTIRSLPKRMRWIMKNNGDYYNC